MAIIPIFSYPLHCFHLGNGRLLSCVRFDRADERMGPKIQAIADNCLTSILPVIRQFLVDQLDACIRDVRSYLAPAQGMVILTRDEPFSRLMIEDLSALVAKLNQKMQELQQLTREIEESLQSTESCLNASNDAFTFLTVGVIVGSVGLAVLANVHVAVLVGGAAGTVINTVEKWCRSNWEQIKDALKKKEEEVKKMQAALQVLTFNLDSLLRLLQKVKSYYDLLHHDIRNDYEEEAVQTKINDLKDGMNLLTSTAAKRTEEILQAEAELSRICNNASATNRTQ